MAAAATVLKTCSALMHNGTERVKCGTEYKGSICPNSGAHLNKYPSGFCNIKSCEGNKPKGNKNKPLPTCKFYMTCPCGCHAQIDEMFKLAEMERVLIENSEYIPEHINLHLDEFKPVDEVVSSLAPVDPLHRPLEEVIAPPIAEPLTTRRTDTGRAARGGLEAQVWEQCRVFVAAGIEATPRLLAEIIADKYHVPTPSTGAIGAVFNRWEKLGFAEQKKKPVRFTGFCGEGTWEELEKIKSKTRRIRRQTESAIKRGYR